MLPMETSPVQLYSTFLVGGPSAPAIARATVAGWAEAPPTIEYDLKLITSELVSNAIKYGRCGTQQWARVFLSRDDGSYRVVVADPGSAMTKPRIIPQQLDCIQEGGRGLALVDTLTQGNWGTHLLPRTKWRVVWAVLGRTSG